MGRGLRKRSVVIAGHRTSVSLEGAFWDALGAIAAERGVSLNRLVAEIDRRRDGNLSSAIRLYVLDWALARPPARTPDRGGGGRDPAPAGGPRNGPPDP